MVSVELLRIAGIVVLVAGVLILLWGILELAKNVIATGFIAIVIALTLLYYTWRMPPRPHEGDASHPKVEDAQQPRQ